jgi:hypothetical protein
MSMSGSPKMTKRLPLPVFPEQRQTSVHQLAGAVIIVPMKTRDVVVYQLGCGGVVADDDEARRNPNSGGGPQVVGLFIMAV